jgi:chromosome segregation ATPase
MEYERRGPPSNLEKELASLRDTNIKYAYMIRDLRAEVKALKEEIERQATLARPKKLKEDYQKDADKAQESIDQLDLQEQIARERREEIEKELVKLRRVLNGANQYDRIQQLKKESDKYLFVLEKITNDRQKEEGKLSTARRRLKKWEELKRQRINATCINCNVAPAIVSCSACVNANYCGQLCADAHWVEGGHWKACN